MDATEVSFVIWLNIDRTINNEMERESCGSIGGEFHEETLERWSD